MLPVLFESSFLFLYSYPLFFGLAWGTGYSLIKQEAFPSFKIFFWGIFLSSWVGAKIMFILTSSQFDALTSQSFWLGGGFVFYGGVLLSLIFCLGFYYFEKRVTLSHFSSLTPVLCFSHGVGRIGCLLAGCCFGSKTTSVFSIHLHGADRIPIQLYEALLLFALGFALNHCSKKNTPLGKTYLFSYAIIRFILEFFRGDHIRGHYFGLLSTSQMISLILVILLLTFRWWGELIFPREKQAFLEKPKLP